MTIDELLLILGLMGMSGFLLVLVILGRSEIKIRFMKSMGRLNGRIIAVEMRKDGKKHVYMPKIQDNRIKLGTRTYDYHIKQTVVNKYNLREGYFSEVSGKQINPWEYKSTTSLSSDQISDMLIFATMLGTMPKPGLFSFKNIPYVFILVIVVVIIAMLTGNVPK